MSLRASSSAFVVALVVAACGSQPNMGVRPIGLPQQAGAGHAERTFVGRELLTLYAQSWRPATEPRAVVVVVHGLKDHSGRYGELADRLVQKGMAVHAMDLRGHARS